MNILEVSPKELDEKYFSRYQNCFGSYYPIYSVGNKEYRLETIILNKNELGKYRGYSVQLHEINSHCNILSTITLPVEGQDIDLYSYRFDTCETLSDCRLW